MTPLQTWFPLQLQVYVSHDNYEATRGGVLKFTYYSRVGQAASAPKEGR